MPLTEAPGAGRLVDIGDTRLFVVEKSLEGLPLVCLHGGPGFDHWSFGDYLDPLAADLRLILVDQRGHGMSDDVDSATLTLGALADDVVRLAEALDVGPVAVLGHSFGGLVGLRAAVDHPDAVQALVVVGTAVRAQPPARALPAAADPARSQEETRAEFEEQASFLFADAADPRRDEWLRQTAPMVFAPQTAAAVSRDGELAARLADVRAPTLVVAGRHDRICSVEDAERLARAVANERFIVFERSGHLPFVEEQAAFLDAVRAFLLG